MSKLLFQTILKWWRPSPAAKELEILFLSKRSYIEAYAGFWMKGIENRTEKQVM